jgi:hypothetical protein
MALIIGSTALDLHFPDLGREPKDLDIFAPPEDSEYWSKAERFWHPLLEGAFESSTPNDYQSISAVTARYRFATPDELYTIKVSHSYWEIGDTWDKHIYDILFLQDKKAKLIQPLHDTLYKIWEEKHGKKRVNLNMTSDEFFTAGVKRIYDHDSIHDSVAYGDHALYEDLLQKDEEVAIDHRRMWEWPTEKLVLLFREEVAATALERMIIPSDYTCSPGLAWTWALRRTITSLTKGKSAQFIVEHFREFMKPDDYVIRHLLNVEKLVRL